MRASSALFLSLFLGTSAACTDNSARPADATALFDLAIPPDLATPPDLNPSPSPDLKPSLPPGLLACLPFEGNTNDTTGNGRNGTAGTSTSYTTGHIGNSIRLAGADNAYVDLNPALAQSLGSFTVAGWLRLDVAAGTFSRFVEFARQDTLPSTGSVFVTLQNGSGMTGKLWAAGTSNETSPAAAAPSVGAWTHIALTYDRGGAGLALYVNGTLSGTKAYNTQGPSDWGPSVIGSLGRSLWRRYDIGYDVDTQLTGAIDEVFVYGRPLSAAEISTLYAGGTGLPCP